MLRAISIAFVMTLVTLPFASHSDERAPDLLVGKVVGVTDGDTLTLLVDREQVRIRLAQIDAPEKGQPFGKRAKSELSRMAFGKQARVEIVDVDRYGRTVGEVHIDGLHVNLEMVRLGYAWAYTEYARSTEIIDLEDEARREQRGLWRLPLSERDQPWEWRSKKKRSRVTQATDECGEKRTCGEMASCAEAHFHLSQCGLSRLDGDGDGVPCESLCR